MKSKLGTRWLSLLLGCMLSASALVPLSAAADEIVTYEPIPITNGGFEEPVSVAAAPGWHTVPAASGGGVTGELSTAENMEGAHSFLLDDASSTKSLALISDKIPVTSGETYRLSASVKVTKASVRTYIKFYNDAGTEVTPSVTALGNTLNQWSILAVEGKAPAGATKAELWFYMGAAGLSTAYVDDVKLEIRRSKEAPPLPLYFGDPVDLGEAVKIPLSQAAAYGQNAQGDNEQYIAVTGSPAVFYAVDAETGERKFSQSLPGTDVIWAMTVAADGNVYLAGTNDGKLYRYLPNEKRLEELGVNPSDKFVWDLKASSDGKVYGATYPNSRVFEYDIASGTFRDLGTMMEGQQYARGLGVTDDYVYIGIGTKAHLIRYDRKTGEKTEIPIPGAGQSGTIAEVQAYGGKLFVNAGSKLYVIDEKTEQTLNVITYQSKISSPSPYASNLIYYKLQGDLYTYNMDTNETAKVEGAPQLPADTAVKSHYWMTLKKGEHAGKTVLAGMAAFTDSFFYDPNDGYYRLSFPDADAQGVSVNALNARDGKVYAGGYQRGLSVFDEKTQKFIYTNKQFHQSEGIAFHEGAVYFGTYPGGKLYRYDPAQPLSYNEYGAGNPGLIADIEDDQDRPFTMISAEGKLIAGTFPSYGKLGGALTILEEQRDASGSVTSAVYQTIRNIVNNQGIFGLAYKDGKVYGGTSIVGGLGSTPTEKEAKIFVYDLKSQTKLAEFTPRIPGLTVPIQTIGELSIGPDGLLWGAVDGAIFAMNPNTYEIVKSKMVYPVTFGSSKFRPYYLRWGDDGLLYTTLGRNLTVIDPETLQTKKLVEGTVNLMALGTDGSVYYALGSKLYRLPVLLDSVSVQLDRSVLTRSETSAASVSGVLKNGKPAILAGADIRYESSDPTVASADNGIVTGHNAGSAEITATVTLNGVTVVSAPVAVTVKVTTESLERTISGLEQEQQVDHPTASQLLASVLQAAHQDEAGHREQARKHIEDLLSHLNKAKEGSVTADADTQIRGDAIALLEDWSR